MYIHSCIYKLNFVCHIIRNKVYLSKTRHSIFLPVLFRFLPNLGRLNISI